MHAILFRLYKSCKFVCNLCLVKRPRFRTRSSVAICQAATYTYDIYLRHIPPTYTYDIYLRHIHTTYTYDIYLRHIHTPTTYTYDIYIRHIHTTYTYDIYLRHIHTTYTYDIYIRHIHKTYTYFKRNQLGFVGNLPSYLHTSDAYRVSSFIRIRTIYYPYQTKSTRFAGNMPNDFFRINTGCGRIAFRQPKNPHLIGQSIRNCNSRVHDNDFSPVVSKTVY